MDEESTRPRSGESAFCRPSGAWRPRRIQVTGAYFDFTQRVDALASRRSGRTAQGSADLPKIVINHAVADVENWLKYHAERVAQLSPFASNITEHVAVDGSKNVALTMDVHDMAGMQSALAAPPPELLAAMDRHGVIPPLAVYVEK